jgi:hypothetical protein
MGVMRAKRAVLEDVSNFVSECVYHTPPQSVVFKVRQCVFRTLAC